MGVWKPDRLKRFLYRDQPAWFWLEKVIWLYESRDEAHKHNLAVNKITKFLGRWLDSGRARRNNTGEIVLRTCAIPARWLSSIESSRQDG
jgi:hypothetical protein